MKTRKSTWFYCSILASLLILAVYVPVPSLAAEVWSDDFDDGNLNGWEILTGDFDVSEGYPNATTYDLSEGVYNFFNTMNRSSTVVVGTWSFDWWIAHVTAWTYMHHQMAYPGVHFFSAGKYDITDTSHSGYALKVTEGANPVFKLMKITNGFSYVIAMYISEGDWFDWFHIDITRNGDGEFNVWIDGEHRIGSTNTDFSESTNFIVDFSLKMCIDNVTVSDTIDLTPPSTDTTTTTTTTTDETTTTTTTPEAGLPIELLAAGVGGAVVLIVIVVFLRKR